MTLRISVTELENYIGKDLGVSRWYEVTQDKIDSFATATGDRQWIHLDGQRSLQDSPYKTTIAHGYFTLSLAPKFMQDILQVTDAQFVVNSGIEKFRLRTPVKTGSRVCMHAVLKKFRALPNGSAHATMRISFEIEGEKKRCAFGEVSLFYVIGDHESF